MADRTGTLSVTLAACTLASAGKVLVHGVSAVTLAACTLSAAGKAIIGAAGNLSIAGCTLSAQGTAQYGRRGALLLHSISDLSASCSCAKGISIAASLALYAVGSGYRVNDLLSLSGGTQVMPARVRVLAVDQAGAITSFAVNQDGLDSGIYTSKPTNPVSVVGGSGTLATFTVTWSDNTPPARAKFARIQVATQNARYRSDGVDPTASVGQLLLVKAAGVDDLTLAPAEMRAAKFIEAVSGATMTVQFLRS